MKKWVYIKVLIMKYLKDIIDLHNRAINSTNNPNDFYEYQIKTCSKEFQD